MPLEDWLDKHPGLHEGPSITANSLWTEFSAAWKIGLDPEELLTKDRFMRAFIVGGHVAKESIHAMVAYDTKPKENKR